ncbi:MAG: GNAT family N-acetyltransferase [Candidatus Aminicenantes bacterium]|nr:GNAT family N-acetyltransferase [Candidatus Aminicenantes bacterium]NLH77883.1 GNAT family N-acetyltransferase [Acidobacteriota bacterium]
MPASIEIRAMRREDAAHAARWAEVEGWATEVAEEFELFLEHEAAGCFLAESGGRPAGVCVATSYDDMGFIGELLVDPGCRGGGAGPALFDRAVAYLDGRGCRTVSLDAVPRAVPFYESRGFHPVCRSLRLRGSIPGAAGEGVRPITAADLPTIRGIDRRAFGGDRSFFLERRAALYPELAWLKISGGRVAGYVFGRRRLGFAWAGPWWADPGDARPATLLSAFAFGAGEAEVRLGALEANARAVALVSGLGFAAGPKPSLRMVRGEGVTLGADPSLLAVGTAAKG